MQDEILICDCESNEHQVIIRYDTDSNEAYLFVHLVKYGFFRRLWMAIRYVFGYRCRYGHWDNLIFKSSHAGRLHDLANFLENTEFQKEPYDIK